MKKNNKYEKKLKVIDKHPKRLIDVKWVVTITLTAFLMSIFFSGVTNITVPNINVVLGVIIVLLIIIVGVLFDVIGVSVTSCSIAPFNSMATKRVKGSRLAIKLIKNAEKTSAFCNDVVGDVCGVISGSVGTMLGILLGSKLGISTGISTLVLTALIAALTIGGKACGKSYAINKSDIIVYKFAKFLTIFIKEK